MILALTPVAARQRSSLAPTDAAVTPLQGSIKPVGKVCEGGEYNSLMLGARVAKDLVPRNFTSLLNAHSMPAFQLTALPVVLYSPLLTASNEDKDLTIGKSFSNGILASPKTSFTVNEPFVGGMALPAFKPD